ncbi:uncharacterized protein LOC114679329 isoform X2 [Macaca mulatta]
MVLEENYKSLCISENMTQIVKVVYSCSALGNVSPVLSAYGCIDSWVLHLSPKLLADALKVRNWTREPWVSSPISPDIYCKRTLPATSKQLHELLSAHLFIQVVFRITSQATDGGKNTNVPSSKA